MNNERTPENGLSMEMVRDWWSMLKYDAGKAPVMPHEEEKQLVLELRRVQEKFALEDDSESEAIIGRITQRLIASNIFYVHKIAARVGADRPDVLPDIMGAGLESLLHTISNTFDPSQGVPLMTFASKDIFWTMLAEKLALVSTVTIPIDKLKELQAETKRKEEAETEDIIQEFAEKFGIDGQLLKAILTPALSLDERIEDTAAYSQKSGGTDNEKLSDTIPDLDNGLSLEENSMRGYFSQEVDDAIATLSPLQRDVIRLRYQSKSDASFMTFPEIASTLGISQKKAKEQLEYAQRNVRIFLEKHNR